MQVEIIGKFDHDWTPNYTSDLKYSNPFLVWCPLLESSVTEKADCPGFAGGGAAGGGDPRNRKGRNDETLGHAAMRQGLAAVLPTGLPE